MGTALFENLEALLEKSPHERHQTLAEMALSDEDRHALERMLARADAPSILDEGLVSLCPSLLFPSGSLPHHFSLVRELGRGGMGVVYLAEDQNLKRFVALKVISAAASLDPKSEERLLREAQAAARLDHPNIVAVYQAERHDQLIYIVCAYIEGGSLDALIDQQRAASALSKDDRRPLTQGDPATDRRWIDRVTQQIYEVARAADYAHRKSVIHRDIKPSNILIDENHKAHLADFGIAKVVDADNRTQTETTIGSPAYMAPEQAGAINEKTAPHTDVYGLGITLYQALTLRLPHNCKSVAELIRWFDLDENPDPRRLNPAVPRPIAQICIKALALSPADRYATAADMAADLEAALRGEFTSPGPKTRPIRRFLKRHKIAAITLTTITVTAAAATLATIMLTPGETTPTGRITVASAIWNPISYRPIDPDLRVALEPVPWPDGRDALRLPEGQYQILFAGENGHIESVVAVEGGANTSATDLLPDHPPPTDGMVFIAGGEVTVGLNADGLTGKRTINLDPYWIDSTEVSHAQYREFVLQTGRDPLPIWPDPYDPSWDDLPVTGMTNDEARAYARWAGKRLPTDNEWEFAAAGVEMRRYPWGDDSVFPKEMVADHENLSTLNTPLDDRAAVAKYIANLSPVRPAQPTRDITPEGLYFMLGNVMEQTSSVFNPGFIGFTSKVLLVKGDAWASLDASPKPFPAILFIDPADRTVGVGFRCVVSHQVVKNY